MQPHVRELLRAANREDRAAFVAAEHRQLQSRDFATALVLLVELAGAEPVEQLLDYVDAAGGTPVVRRVLANIRAIKGGQ